jgi:hypothetical protein
MLLENTLHFILIEQVLAHSNTGGIKNLDIVRAVLYKSPTL